jgi:hypothetical protein
LKILNIKRAGRVAQGVDPEFKPQYCKKEKLKIEQPYDPVIQSQGTSRLQQRHLYTNVYHSTTHNSQATETTQMPHTDEWIRKMWHTCIMELDSARRNMACGLKVNGCNRRTSP